MSIGGPSVLHLPADPQEGEPASQATLAPLLGRPLDFPTLCGVDPEGDEEESCVRVDRAAAMASQSSSNCLPPSPCHREKALKAQLPLWCGMLTRVIKAGTDEFKSAPCTKAQLDEKSKLESQGTWELESVREWSAVRRDPDLKEATVARLFVIMGRKGDEMIDSASDRSSEIK